MLFGVIVEEGIAKVGTPICIPTKENMMVGIIAGIQANRNDVQIAKAGEQVALKIEHGHRPGLMYGRHFDHNDKLVSKITRDSIDLLKENFKDDLAREDWRLVIRLKKLFGIL
jgi:translation initiation factor 5B